MYFCSVEEVFLVRSTQLVCGTIRGTQFEAASSFEMQGIVNTDLILQNVTGVLAYALGP